MLLLALQTEQQHLNNQLLLSNARVDIGFQHRRLLH